MRKLSKADKLRNDIKAIELQTQSMSVFLLSLKKGYAKLLDEDFCKRWDVDKGDRLRITTTHSLYEVYYEGYIYEKTDAFPDCRVVLSDGSEGEMRKYISGRIKKVERI